MCGMFSRGTKEGKSEKWHQNGKTFLYLAANTKWTQVNEWTNMSAILLDIISVSFLLRISVCFKTSEDFLEGMLKLCYQGYKFTLTSHKPQYGHVNSQ